MLSRCGHSLGVEPMTAGSHVTYALSTTPPILPPAVSPLGHGIRISVVSPFGHNVRLISTFFPLCLMASSVPVSAPVFSLHLCLTRPLPLSCLLGVERSSDTCRMCVRHVSLCSVPVYRLGVEEGNDPYRTGLIPLSCPLPGMSSSYRFYLSNRTHSPLLSTPSVHVTSP